MQRSLAVAGCLIIGACGRIGFDPGDDDSGGGGDATMCPSVPRYIQGACSDAAAMTSTLSVTVPLTGGQTTLIVAVDFDSTTSDVSITDSIGHDFLAVSPVSRSASQSSRIWYAGPTRGGLDQITIQLTVPAEGVAVHAHEYAGLATTDVLDAMAIGTGNGSFLETPDFVTSRPNELVFAHGCIFNITIGDAGLAFVARQTCNGNMTEDRIAPTAGIYNATLQAVASETWLASVAAFRPACP